MDIRQALTKHLEAALSLPDCRVHRVRAPAGTQAPYVILTKVSTVEEATHSGLIGLATNRFQLDVYAQTNTEAAGLVAEIRAALDSVHNAVMGGPGGVFVAWCEFDDEQDLYESQPEMYRVSMDYMIRYKDD